MFKSVKGPNLPLCLFSGLPGLEQYKMRIWSLWLGQFEVKNVKIGGLDAVLGQIEVG